MLKISLVFNSNIRNKASEAVLLKFYSKLYKNFSSFFNHRLSSNSKITVSGVKLTSKLRKGKLTLLRSPFHFKISKTILTNPLQQFTISIFIPVNIATPITTKTILAFFNSLNLSTTFTIKTVRLEHINVKF